MVAHVAEETALDELRLLGSGEKPARKYKYGHTSGDRVFAGDSQFTPPARKSAFGAMMRAVYWM
jgi:hypothetical protein